MSTTSFNIRQLVNPTDEEIDQGAHALASAFRNRYFFDALGGDESLVRQLLRAHITTALFAGDEVYYAEIPGQGVVGVSVWFGPGQMFLNSEEQRQAGWNQVMEKLDQKYQLWWAYFISTYNEICERSLGSGTKLAAYHLQIFGVVPEQQRKGIGAALMKAVENKAKSTNTDLCLENIGSLKTVDIYKGMGFTLEGAEDAKTVSGGETKIYVMLKHTAKNV